jgi:16S rRNA (guanine1207-N2)-methyltransferase
MAVADFVFAGQADDVLCYQMDLFKGQQLKKELKEVGQQAKVVVSADLWDLETPLQTAVFPVSHKGERSLKLDMVEQAYHVLRSNGNLIVVSPYAHDQLFPQMLKKIFGKVHIPQQGGGMVFWAMRTGERPRRRHEISFQVSRDGKESLKFLSRPGVFSYGRFDNGARALVEVMEIHEGDHVLDLGCGCGTNGVIAGLRAGENGSVVFLDSNLRALTLAEHNAAANGLKHFTTLAKSSLKGLNVHPPHPNPLPPGEREKNVHPPHPNPLPPGEREKNAFDVVLANPPYFAQATIAKMFIQESAQVLKPGGRLYLVTKQPNELIEMFEEAYDQIEIVQHRGYSVFCCAASK